MLVEAPQDKKQVYAYSGAARISSGSLFCFGETDMRKKVIIDCDPGIDDSLAIMLALSMEEIDVLGITVVAGNSPVNMGYENALKILQFMDRLDIPVFKGADKPLEREYVNALDTHGPDGLGESYLPPVAEDACQRQTVSAVSFMKKTLRDSSASDPVSIIALGPLTNVASLAMEDPAAFAAIDTIVSMGGSCRSHGNCSPVAEYNYWCDPDAAAFVYREMDRLGKMIHMVGLDVTRKIVLTPDLLSYMKRLDQRMGDFVERITKFYFDFHWEWEHLIGCVINDPLAVAYFARRDLCSGIERYVQVETQGICQGQSVVDTMNFYRHAPNAVVLMEVDAPAFFKLFFTQLLHLDSEPDLIGQLVTSNTAM